jgi:hypothetical protein
MNLTEVDQECGQFDGHSDVENYDEERSLEDATAAQESHTFVQECLYLYAGDI